MNAPHQARRNSDNAVRDAAMIVDNKHPIAKEILHADVAADNRFQNGTDRAAA
jgi:hypothetical protein